MASHQGARGTTPPSTDTQRNASDATAVTDPLWPAQPRRSSGRTTQGWRATDGSFAPPGGGATLWPSWSPLVWSAGPAAARFGEHGGAWAIRQVSVNRACVPKSHPAIGEPALGRLRTGWDPSKRHDPGDVSASLRSHGPDRTVSPPWKRSHRPTEARAYPARVTGKQANAQAVVACLGTAGLVQGRAEHGWRGVAADTPAAPEGFPAGAAGASGSCWAPGQASSSSSSTAHRVSSSLAPMAPFPSQRS